MEYTRRAATTKPTPRAMPPLDEPDAAEHGLQVEVDESKKVSFTTHERQ